MKRPIVPPKGIPKYWFDGAQRRWIFDCMAGTNEPIYSRTDSSNKVHLLVIVNLHPLTLQ